jgi:glycine/D-amino acid oxidase-like deaminating enzyme
VKLADGSTIHSGSVVNAAGPWCNHIDRMAGLEHKWDLAPTRIQVGYRTLPAEVPGRLPVVGDITGGIYFRPESNDQQILFGSTLEEDERERVDPEAYDTSPDWEFTNLRIHGLHHRIPSLPHRGDLQGMIGLYTVNRHDVHPVVGPTAIDGYIVCNGFSGHGFKESPMVGSMLAQYLTGERASYDTDVPIEFFSVDREPLTGTGMNVLA